MLKEYKDEVDFEIRMDDSITRKEVLENLKNIIKRIESGKELMIEFFVKTQEVKIK